MNEKPKVKINPEEFNLLLKEQVEKLRANDVANLAPSASLQIAYLQHMVGMQQIMVQQLDALILLAKGYMGLPTAPSQTLPGSQPVAEGSSTTVEQQPPLPGLNEDSSSSSKTLVADFQGQASTGKSSV